MTGQDIGVLVLTTGDVGTLLSGSYFVKHVRWVGATTAGHACELLSGSGSSIFKSAADGVNFIDVHPIYRIFNGLRLQTMDSGELFVYLA